MSRALAFLYTDYFDIYLGFETTRGHLVRVWLPSPGVVGTDPLLVRHTGE